MSVTSIIQEVPDNLSRVIYTKRICLERSRYIKSDEAAIHKDEPMVGADVVKNSDHLTLIVDVSDTCNSRSRHVNNGEGSARVEETMALEIPDDLAGVIDAISKRSKCAGPIDICEAAITVKEAAGAYAHIIGQ